MHNIHRFAHKSDSASLVNNDMVVHTQLANVFAAKMLHAPHVILVALINIGL